MSGSFFHLPLRRLDIGGRTRSASRPMAALLDDVLRDLEPRLGPRSGDPVVLESGLTNRNLRVRLGDGEYVVRLPGADTELLGIDREAERAATAIAHGLGVGPEVVAFVRGCLVTRFIEARSLTPDAVREPGTLAEVAAALRAVHAGPPIPGTFSVSAICRAYAGSAAERGGDVPADYERGLALTERVERAVAGHPEHAPVPCHADLLTANLLHDGTRIRIVDWELSGMGDRFFDLGNLAVNHELDEAGEETLLGAYFGEPATPRRLAALRLQRLLSDYREAMWGVLQVSLSELGNDYVAYARRHFDRLDAARAASPVDEWIEEAAHGA